MSEDDVPEVKGAGIYNVDNEPVALLNGHDLAGWLRHAGHRLTTHDRSLTNDIADIIESLSDELLRRDLGL